MTSQGPLVAAQPHLTSHGFPGSLGIRSPSICFSASGPGSKPGLEYSTLQTLSLLSFAKGTFRHPLQQEPDLVTELAPRDFPGEGR